MSQPLYLPGPDDDDDDEEDDDDDDDSESKRFIPKVPIPHQERKIAA